MEYKTKGKEGTDAKGQKNEIKLAKVNKKRGNDSKRPGKEKADDISNNFPNFSVLTKEEKLAFFEALSSARKNIEKRGLPTRERFGTVHDEYLQYFSQDDKVHSSDPPIDQKSVPTKPETAPLDSVRPSWSPVAARANPKDSQTTPAGSPKKKVPRSSKPAPANLKKPSKPPPKVPLRPETAPIDKCEEVIERDTDKMIQMYLNKKKRIEEQWKKSSAGTSPPGKTTTAHSSPKPKTRETVRPQSARPGSSTAKPPSKTIDTPHFQALNPTERKEFFRILKEAHNNLLAKNPENSEIRTLEEVLQPYSDGGGKVTTICTATKNVRRSREQAKNLRVKVTLTSGDKERLTRTKSETLCDIGSEGSGGRSKSLESVLSADTVHGKQSQIPVLRKSPQRWDEDDQETKTLGNPDQHLQEFAPARPAAEATTTASRGAATTTTAEECKKEAGAKGKLPLIEGGGADKKTKTVTSNKKRTAAKSKARKAGQAPEDGGENSQGENCKNLGMLKLKALMLDKRKLEFKKLQKEKDRQRAEAAKKEMELLKKKKREDWKRRHQKKEKTAQVTAKANEAKKNSDHSCDLPEVVVFNKELIDNDCLEEIQEEPNKEVEKEQLEREDVSCEKSGEAEEEKCENDRQAGTADEKHEATKKPSDETESFAEEESPDQQTSSEESLETPDECQEAREERPESPEECEDGPEVGRDREEPSDSCQSFSSQVAASQVVKTATQSGKSLAGMSLVEDRPKEVWAPNLTSGKVVMVDDNVIGRIKDLIQYLEKKVNPEDSLESEYVRLVLSYTEYLTKVTESIVRGNAGEGQRVHSTYTAHEVHLKFEDNEKETGKEKENRLPRSISENEFYRQNFPGPSGVEKKPQDKSEREESKMELLSLSDSETSLKSNEENWVFSPSSFKKTGIPMSKIRLLQDLLKGRAKFVEGSIEDFKIIHCPQAEYVLPEKIPKEEAKEITEPEVEQVNKVIRTKFLKALAKLCNCGKKQIEEDAILENLKGEAVRVDTTEGKKDPTSATINQSTMEVLKAAERKKIIQKYLQKDQS